jgi:hypothetical protein
VTLAARLHQSLHRQPAARQDGSGGAGRRSSGRFEGTGPDLVPDLKSTGGYVLDKVEGLAITEDGTGWISTDNDGADDHSGETMFFSIGQI